MIRGLPSTQEVTVFMTCLTYKLNLGDFTSEWGLILQSQEIRPAAWCGQQ